MPFKMHIVFVSHEYAHPQLPNAGGIGHFLAEYTKLLVEKGHEVTVFGYSDASLETEYNGVKLFFKKTTMTPLHILLERIFHKLGWSRSLIPFHAKDRFRLAQRVDYFCEHNHVDIIELNDYLGDGAFLKNSIPKVIRIHGAYKLLAEDLGFRVNKSFEYFEEEQVKLVQNYIGVSQFSADRFKALFNISTPIHTVYNGVNTNGIYRKAFPEVSRMFYFGTLSHAKGTDRLIEIFNDLAIRFPNMEFVIAGKTEEYYKQEVEPKFNQEVKSRIQFLGFISKEEIEKQIDKSTYIIFPSRLENFSVALLEAMSRGRVCFAWDIPSFNEIIEDRENGYILKDLGQVAQHIENLETDKMLRFQVSENAYNCIQEHFSKDRMVDESIKVYQQVINHIENN